MTDSYPTRRLGSLRFHATILVALAITAGPSESQVLPRVRSDSPAIADSIARGLPRSPTLRRLVDSINATDGLVYVDEGNCGNSANACLLSSVLIAGPYRVLRIQVNLRKGQGCDLVASIGHELQHALEVLSNARIRDHSQFYHFFDRVGTRDENRFETKAALRMGLTVAKECGRD